ncbi:type II toxin-antitoxin system PemK/MazF family toxin [Microcoleus sp. bin38.metabat.b11b12b14.051]|uniref:type II toxin-antitoxin system PemK/MazF family toxin n=1 Tax=Microcoleus sp. bin38.metabat.b11b12b14.051 TaxID=2742709 RepID=UPI0025E198FF|nr:type II toxin-antitoxin system PemK/MazF family toxin [Microcoleus sp. bin38.metabat.b11b12b14.051]
MSFNPGDIITVDFPGVTGIKRRPAVVLSSATYHANRPDVIVGLITTQTTMLGITDYVLQDWEAAGLRAASVFRSFIVTLPPAANLVRIGQLSERDWQGVRVCVKLAIAE